jgi:hypothetical protein
MRKILIVRVHLSLAVCDFRDPKTGLCANVPWRAACPAQRSGSQRRTNGRGSCPLRVRRGKHAGQPDDIRAYRTVRFMLQHDGIVIRHARCARPT